MAPCKRAPRACFLRGERAPREGRHKGGGITVTPDEIQQGFIDGFLSRGDTFEQFDYLLELSAKLDELPDEKKTEDVLVKGCQSQVWLYPAWCDGEPGASFSLAGDSDTLMVRGVIYMFQQMFQGQGAQAIIDCPVRFVDETELAYIFDAQRQAGVSAIATTVKEFARKALSDKEEPHHG